MVQINKDKAKLMHYIDTNATTYIWDNNESLTVHIDDKEKFLQ